jgi:hypothetical protein
MSKECDAKKCIIEQKIMKFNLDGLNKQLIKTLFQDRHYSILKIISRESGLTTVAGSRMPVKNYYLFEIIVNYYHKLEDSNCELGLLLYKCVSQISNKIKFIADCINWNHPNLSLIQITSSNFYHRHPVNDVIFRCNENMINNVYIYNSLIMLLKSNNDECIKKSIFKIILKYWKFHNEFTIYGWMYEIY